MLNVSFTALLQGFGLGASLIIAIGAQNAFVLRQGLKRQHVFITALLCSLCDVALIALGVGGLGLLIASVPALTAVATWGGAAFLLFYGLRAFRSAASPGSLEVEPGAAPVRAWNIALATLAISLLNPHVYLDTVVLLGSIGARYPAAERWLFAAGAAMASAIWFFGLGYGAAWLTPLFRRPVAWRILDAAVGCVMWAICASLIWGGLHQPHV